MSDDAILTFERSLRGRLIRPTDADYDTARAVYNGMIDRRPRLISRPVDTADVIACVTYAREQNLLVAIRGCGHNGPGLGTCEDGLVIDLGEMKAVHVDPAKRRELYVEFQRRVNTELPLWMAIERLLISVTNQSLQNHHNTPRWISSSWHDLWVAA